MVPTTQTVHDSTFGRTTGWEDDKKYTTPKTNSKFAPENKPLNAPPKGSWIFIPTINFQLQTVSFREGSISYSIHGTGIFSYMKTIKNQPNVGKYTQSMVSGIGFFQKFVVIV